MREKLPARLCSACTRRRDVQAWRTSWARHSSLAWDVVPVRVQFLRLAMTVAIAAWFRQLL